VLPRPQGSCPSDVRSRVAVVAENVEFRSEKKFGSSKKLPCTTIVTGLPSKLLTRGVWIAVHFA
jgi:hypothetical protein